MSSPKPTPASDKTSRWIEDIFILLCIASLWPAILGWQEPIYQFLLYIALVGLVVIFLRRQKRLRDASRQTK